MGRGRAAGGAGQPGTAAPRRPPVRCRLKERPARPVAGAAAAASASWAAGGEADGDDEGDGQQQRGERARIAASGRARRRRAQPAEARARPLRRLKGAQAATRRPWRVGGAQRAERAQRQRPPVLHRALIGPVSRVRAVVGDRIGPKAIFMSIRPAQGASRRAGPRARPRAAPPLDLPPPPFPPPCAGSAEPSRRPWPACAPPSMHVWCVKRVAPGRGCHFGGGARPRLRARAHRAGGGRRRAAGPRARGRTSAPAGAIVCRGAGIGGVGAGGLPRRGAPRHKTVSMGGLGAGSRGNQIWERNVGGAHGARAPWGGGAGGARRAVGGRAAPIGRALSLVERAARARARARAARGARGVHSGGQKGSAGRPTPGGKFEEGRDRWRTRHAGGRAGARRVGPRGAGRAGAAPLSARRPARPPRRGVRPPARPPAAAAAASQCWGLDLGCSPRALAGAAWLVRLGPGLAARVC
jgi:hypothetical protein